MEEKYAIVKIKDESGNYIYNFMVMDFLTPQDAIDYRDNNFDTPSDYIVVRYFV